MRAATCAARAGAVGLGKGAFGAARVPNFLAYPPVEDGATRERLGRLARDAKTDDWKRALENAFGNQPEMIRYVTLNGRASFVPLLGLAPDDQSGVAVVPGVTA